MKTQKSHAHLLVFVAAFFLTAELAHATPSEDLALRRQLREKCSGMQFTSKQARNNCLRDADKADLTEVRARLAEEERQKKINEVNDGISTARRIGSLFGF